MKIQGCDISRYQDDITTAKRIDFAKMKAAGVEFVLMRALFGTTQDRDFAYNWKAAKAAGLLVGLYAFLTFDGTQAQFDALMKLTGGDFGDITPTIDYEPYNYNGLVTVPPVSSLTSYLGMLQTACGKYPMIYTGYYVWRDNGNVNPMWVKHPLWIATYAAQPMIPAPWTEYAVWQYTNKGSGPMYGVESLDIDLDYFNGTRDELKNLGSMKPVIPVPPIDQDALLALTARVAELERWRRA